MSEEKNIRERRLTGAYLSAVRDGKRRPVDVSDMTEEEIREKFAGRSAEELLNWIVLLVGAIRKIGGTFNIETGEREGGT